MRLCVVAARLCYRRDGSFGLVALVYLLHRKALIAVNTVLSASSGMHRRAPTAPEEDTVNATGHVLVIADDPLSRDRIGDMLGVDGYAVEVWVAATAHAALDLVGKQHPDVILLDMRMPMTDADWAVATPLHLDARLVRVAQGE